MGRQRRLCSQAVGEARDGFKGKNMMYSKGKSMRARRGESSISCMFFLGCECTQTCTRERGGIEVQSRVHCESDVPMPTWGGVLSPSLPTQTPLIPLNLWNSALTEAEDSTTGTGGEIDLRLASGQAGLIACSGAWLLAEAGAAGR